MTRFHRPLLALLLLLVLAVPLGAQEGAAVRPIAPGEARTDSLAGDASHVYTLELPGDRFVQGVVDQRTVDVVATVRDPSGAVLGRFNRRRSGDERVHFDAESAGTYRIELAPAGQQGGRYTLRLDRTEAIATDPAARVDQLMVPWSGDGPGGLVGVVRDGELVLARAYGMANLTHDVPYTLETRTNIGSTTKQFTAFAIKLLEERGELSLDDDVREHIPEVPAFDHPVTLRHLLTHTSGYREFLNTLALGGRRIDAGDRIDRDEIIRIVQRQPELQNEPGAEWNYNNTGFALLATIIERVTDTPYPEWMRENVFLPLGMDDTFVRATPWQIIENSAQGYLPTPDGYRQAPDLGGAMGAGGIYTTVGDLAKWVRNLQDPELGSPAIVEDMTTPYVLTTGDTTSYGLGLFIDEFRGTTRIHHGGADLAHRSEFALFPETGTAVVVLSNYGAFSGGSVLAGVAGAYLGDALEPEDESPAAAAGQALDPEPYDPASYDPEDFDDLAGRYSLDEAPSFILSFFREGDTLYTQATGQPRVRILPTSDSTFTLVGIPASLTFHTDGDGEVTHLTLHQNGDHRATPIEADVWEPAEAELEAYTGRYYSEELETFYTLALEDGSLVVRHRRFDDDVALEPGEERDHFTGTFPIGSIEFLRDDSGRVTALLASNVRARGIRFERVE